MHLAISAALAFASSICSLVPAAALQSAPDCRRDCPPARPPSATGVVLIAHGGGPDWNAQVERMAREVRHPGPVAVSFLMGPGAKTAPFQKVVADLVTRGAQEVLVVPVLVSSHSGHYDQLRWLAGEIDSIDAVMTHHLEMGGIARSDAAVPIRLLRAMDDAPELAAVLADRARALVDNPAGRALLLLGHGPESAEEYAYWMENLRRVADTVRERTGFSSVMVELVRDDAAEGVRKEAVRRMRELVLLQRDATGKDVAVVPVLVASGSMTRDKLPRDLAGLPIVYRGDALLADTELARWVEARIRQARSSDVSSADRAFRSTPH
ncbi:MAG: CbiX/SirB N-terminal domain-containing protein [Gemmatimonadales bacterium]